MSCIHSDGEGTCAVFNILCEFEFGLYPEDECDEYTKFENEDDWYVDDGAGIMEDDSLPLEGIDHMEVLS